MSALAAGALSKVKLTSTTASLSSAAATGGTGPYTYQWYMSTVSGFTPGPTNLVAGATALDEVFSGLKPGSTYYFVVVATDSVPDSANSAQLTVVTAPEQNQNQFSQTPVIGMPDQKPNYNTTPVVIDATQADPLAAGSAVQIIATSNGVPKVVASEDTDPVYGFLCYDVKSIAFVAGDAAEMAQAGDVLYFIAEGAIDAGERLQLGTGIYQGGLMAAAGSSGKQYVGWSMDAVQDGQLFRAKLATPSFVTL